MSAPPRPRHDTGAVRVAQLVIVAAIAIALTVAAVALRSRARQPDAETPSRDELLSDPVIRGHLHELMGEVREVEALRAQPAPADERGALVLERERLQVVMSWKRLYGEWTARHGRPQDCPLYEDYRAELDAAQGEPAR